MTSEPALKPGRSTRALEVATFALILIVAAGLRTWGLDRNGYGNTYYAAAVRSMLASGSNFFFGAFDPGGYVTVDKPPVALWYQAIFAAIFGYDGVNLLLPQAIAGVATVALLIRVVGRAAGTWAGLAAGFVLAISPMTVAVDRDNLPDTLLSLVLVAAAGFVLRAAEAGKFRHLAIAAVLVGVGFNIKMLAAFIVLPAFYATYFLGAATSFRSRFVHLTIATIVIAAVSLSWPVAVDLTPKDKRPYMGGSTNNSALDLALGYNGLGRVFGGSNNFSPGGGGMGGPGRGGMGGPRGGFPGGMMDGPRGGMMGGPGGGPPGGMMGGPGGMAMGLMPFASAAGPFRLLMPEFAGQISWMFPLAIVGVVSAALRLRPWIHSGTVGRSLLLWLGWLTTHAVVFSFSQGIVHPYYVTIMSPAVGALVGHGLAALASDFRVGERRKYAMLALGATAAWQCVVVAVLSASWRVWLVPLTASGAALGLWALLRTSKRSEAAPGLYAALFVGGLLATSAAPFAWSLTPVLAKGNSLIPAADPALLSGGSRFEPPGFAIGNNAKLIAFLRANRNGTKFLLATPNAPPAASIIVETGEPVMALGGFMGGDPILTREEFAAKVASGEVRFVQLMGGMPGGPPGGGMGGPPGMRTEIQEWVREHGKIVDAKLWRTESPEGERPPAFGPFAGSGSLYDCRPELGLKPVDAAEGGTR